MKTGRPSKYTEEIIKKAENYIYDYETYNDIIPSIVGLASILEVTRTTLYKWEKEHEEFSYILENIKREQEKVLLNKGLIGDFNSAITKLVLGKHGYHDKQDLGLEANMSITIGKDFEGI